MSHIPPLFSIKNVHRMLLLFAIVWIPLGTRKFVLHFTPGFDEYESIFIYASDLVIVAFFVAFVWRFVGQVRAFRWRAWVPPGIFLAIAAASIVWAHHHTLAAYAFGRLLFAVLFFGAVGYSFFRDRRLFDSAMIVVALSAVLQAVVGMGQFFLQRSVGLSFFGESYLGPGATGVARIPTEFGRLLRAYGTLPHANIYAGFLVIGLVALCYLWMRKSEMFARVSRKASFILDGALTVSIFLVITGLMVSFSRAGWVSAAVALSLFFVCVLWRMPLRARAAILVLTVFLSGIVVLWAFRFAAAPRIEMTTRADHAIAYRISYNELGMRLIRDNPAGVGIGNQVWHAVDEGYYRAAGMHERWEWQPIHNIYLLMASEVGIAGGAAFAMFIIFLASSLFIRRRETDGALFAAAYAMAAAVLVFGLFDHFLWSLQPGRLMLWFALSLAAAAGVMYIQGDTAR